MEGLYEGVGRGSEGMKMECEKGEVSGRAAEVFRKREEREKNKE